jgi:hypothetical protein
VSMQAHCAGCLGRPYDNRKPIPAP